MVDPLSLIPLHVETFFVNDKALPYSETKVSDATAFVFSGPDGKNFLITNWHVVSGRHPTTNSPLSPKAAIPNVISCWFHGSKEVGTWVRIQLPLVNWGTEEKLWLEHPMGKNIDVIALPLEDLFITLYPLYPNLFITDVKISPSEPVSIIGFPFGLPSSGQLPIWKTGHVASDTDFDFDDKPAFLIDATVRPGMSGSPVVVREREFLSDDKSIFIPINASKFLGIFSGGMKEEHKDIEIGIVWKPVVIDEILQTFNS